MKSKLTNCKVCGAEVAKSASSCPKCGAKMKKKNPLLGILLIIFGFAMIGIAFGGGGDGPEKVGDAGSSSSAASSQEQTVFGVGDQVALNDVVVTFNGVTESPGTEFNRPGDGNVFLVCEFTIENNSSQDVNVSSMLCFEAYVDDYTTSMSLSAMVLDTNKAQLDGTVAAGKKMNGIIGYEVSSEWKELEVRFTPDFWAQKDITFIAEH